MTKIQPIDLPLGEVSYPKDLDDRLNELMARYEQTKVKVDIRESLSLISDFFNLFADQMTYETAIQTKALSVIMRDRAERERKKLIG